jgi:hypothetical protein
MAGKLIACTIAPLQWLTGVACVQSRRYSSSVRAVLYLTVTARKRQQ